MAAETALARQLKKLAVPQTTVLFQDKIRKSFLFDHRDAAGLDRELVFSYGTNGIEKLRIINPLFSKFESNIFSLNYKEYERSVQSKNANKKLDGKISEFLRMLSPYFLIKAAHEALEWLIYRFHIHMFNVDDLVASVLPHYNTSTFVRVVQLLDLDEGSRWYWLKLVQKTGVHLDYSALLNRFISDGGFRKFVCDIAPNVLKVYKDYENIAMPVISFSMLTIYNALDKCQIIEDKFITLLFPYILNGLVSDLSKYAASAFLVISQIVLKVKLTPEITAELLNRLFHGVKEDLTKEVFELLLLVFQNQSIKSIPKKVFSFIFSSSESMNILCHLVQNYESLTLIQGIIKKSIIVLFNTLPNTKKSKKALKFVMELINNIKLDEMSVLLCFNSTLKSFSKCYHDKKFEKHQKHFKKMVKCVLRYLETKYPEYFDKAHRNFLDSKSKLNKKMLCRLINNSVCSVKYKILPDMKTSLVLGLNHANPLIRQTAVSYLFELVRDNKFSEKEFIEESLYERLLDQSPEIVEEILSDPDVVFKIIGQPKMLLALENILSNKICLKSNWFPVQMTCLKIIINYFGKDEHMFDILPSISQFLFPVNKHTIQGFTLLLNSCMENAFVKELQIQQWNIEGKVDSFFEINCNIVSVIETFIEKMNPQLKVDFALYLMHKVRYSFLSFYIYAMRQIIITGIGEDKDSIKYIEHLLQVFKFYFSHPSVIIEKYEDVSSEKFVIKKVVSSLNKMKCPAILMCDTFRKIITEININLDCELWPNLTGNQNYIILTILFDFCILNLNSGKEVLREFFKSMFSFFISHQLKSTLKTFWFLSFKWGDYSNDVPLVSQLFSINVATALCQQQNSIDWLFDNDMIFFCMIKAIANPNNSLSHAALNLLSLSLNSAKNCTHPLKFLAEEICTRSEEIKVDYRQCFECVGNWLNTVIEYVDLKKNQTAPVTKDFQNRKLILDKLLNLITQDIPYSMKHFLLLCLQNADSIIILSAYIPILLDYLTLLYESYENKDILLSMIELLLKKFSPKTAQCIIENSEETKALLHCLNFGNKVDEDKSVQIAALNILNKDFFVAIPSVVVQQEIFEVLLTSYMTSPASINAKVEKVLRKLSTYAYIFLKHFQDKELSVSKGTTLREAKKSRTKYSADNADTFENGSWKKVIIFLELMQSKSKLMKKELLIQELFNLLNKSLDFDSQAQVEYLRQLILSAIYTCCQQLGSGLDERQFQVELIVHCIRSSTNAKTHHQSLLLLNLAATMCPDYVLSNVMSIFTFMGSSLVRQDDSYSFQVISQTIETIVPSLLEASNQQTETDGIQVVSSVIRVFVDSLSDIPGHRQLPLFTKLISTLDPSKYLWIPLGQICDQYATIFHDLTIDDSKNWKVSPTLEFAVNLHKQFSPDIQIDTCVKLINFLTILPDSKQQLDSNPDAYVKIKEPFYINNHTDKQIQIYKQNVLSYMKIWLSSQAFLSQVLDLNAKEQYRLEEKYELLLESVLSFLQDRLSIKESEKDTKDISSQVQILYDLVHAINSLLPCNLFICVIQRLLKHSEKEIQMKAIELLNSKLEQQQDFVHQENHKALLKLLKPLLKLVNKCINENSKDDKHAIIEQTALYALHLLSKLLGSEYPSKFYKVLNVSITILSLNLQPELTVNALLCLAELCNCLNVGILPHLNLFMPVIVNILQDAKVLNMSECLILGVIAALKSIIENLGIFLSSYMEAIITGICMFSVRFSELGKKTISEKFVNLQSKIANEIVLRLLLTAIENSYLQLSSENASNIVPLMNILTEKLNSSNYEDILASSHQLQKFFLSLLDFRNCNQQLPEETIAQVENSIVSSLETFVMKLSITRFRNFFQKIYQWSTSVDYNQEQKHRIYTFYKLTSDFSKSLKSLFSHMAKYFFRHAATTIESNNFSKSNAHYFKTKSELSHELLFNVLDTLSSCFMHAEDQLLDKENFDLLMQPLVDQIENLDNETVYQDLVENHLSSCIAYFMAAVSDTALWKASNYQILLKTRHDSPKVRFGALQVIQEVVNKMGDNYLVLLPESIPFLAEMMEDESTEVEQECQSVIIEMEKILGEPIRKYF